MHRWLLLFLLPLLGGCRQAVPQLNIFTWSEYLDPQAIAQFEETFGCRVSLDYYEDPESMMAKLASGGASLYDIVIPSNSNLPALVKRGLLAPLRPENIPNLAHIDPRFRDASFDPGNRYGAPYLWATTGLYVRKRADQTTEPSWRMLFDANHQGGSFLLLDDPRSCLGAALKFRGHSLNTTDPKALQEAVQLLASAKRRSLGFEGSVGARNRVLAKEATAAMVYSVEAVRGMDEDPETEYLIPQEGSEIWLDLLAIPADAPHRDLAEKFINFMLEPRIAARTAEFNRAATPNQGARPLLPASSLNNPAIYPPAEVMDRLEWASDLGPGNLLYDDAWTQVKSR